MRPTSASFQSSWLWLIALSLLPLSPQGTFAGELTPKPRLHSSPARVTCDASVQHPIQVKIEALDPIRRGATVRLRLTSSSGVALNRAEARIVSAGEASVLGRSRAPLGIMGARREATADFTVALPAQGGRQLIQFRVEGEGTAGRIGRGAAFNLLPDGPSTPARIVAGASGQLVAEYPARRIPR